MPASVRQVHWFHLLVSLSRSGSSGCLLWLAREASGFPNFPSVFAHKGLRRANSASTPGAIRAIGRRMAPPKSRQKRRDLVRADTVGNFPPRMTGCVPRIEQCVCHWAVSRWAVESRAPEEDRAEARSIYASTNTSLSHSTNARNKIEKWRVEYNRECPHSSVGNLTPEEFAARHQMSSAITRTALASGRTRAGRRGATRSGLGSES